MGNFPSSQKQYCPNYRGKGHSHLNGEGGIFQMQRLDLRDEHRRKSVLRAYTGFFGADMTANDYYALSGGERKPVASETTALGTFRWYLKAESRNASAEPLPAKMQVRVVDPSAGSTTGIEAATATEKSTAIKIYTMTDRKTSRFGSMDEVRKRLPADLHIVNGKKVLF